jgi:hypothetical protein
MSRAEDWQVERREGMRQMAYEMAESGLFARWEAIESALRCRYDVADVRSLFASAFCRVDLDQRCSRATHAVSAPSVRRPCGPALGNGIDEKLTSTGRSAETRCITNTASLSMSRTAAGKRRRPTTGERIGALMADGRERTVADLAEQLGVGKQNVSMALAVMQVEGVVHVTGRVECPRGRRSARVFGLGPSVDDVPEPRVEPASCWPQSDPVVVAGIDAMVRCR